MLLITNNFLLPVKYDDLRYKKTSTSNNLVILSVAKDPLIAVLNSNPSIARHKAIQKLQQS